MRLVRPPGAPQRTRQPRIRPRRSSEFDADIRAQPVKFRLKIAECVRACIDMQKSIVGLFRHCKRIRPMIIAAGGGLSRRQ